MTSWQVVKMALIGATTALVAATIIAPAVTTPAAAAEFTRRPQANGPDIITINGIIDPGDNKKFVQVVLEIKHASIVLNSRGGYIQDAIAIGGLVRSRNYETRVENGAVCNSACTLIWLAGASRRLGSRARLGFHSAATTLRPPYKRFEPGNGVIALYMARLGVPQQVIDLQPKADPCCFNYVGYAQAKAWGLLSDHSAKQQQALPTLESQQQATTVPTSPKPVITVPVQPTLPEPVPQQALPTPQTQQPAPAPKTQERFEPRSQQAPATPAPAPGTQPAVTAAQKVVLYEEDPADPNGKRFVGSAIWRTETITARLGQPPELVIRADIEVPERKLAMTWSLRPNTDKGLPASHTVEIMFKLPADFPSGGISNVPGILMKQAEQTRGVPLAGLAVKVTPGFYLIGLSNLEADKERNLQLLMERGWFDIPVVYNNNRRAILAMEKGTPGERVFAETFRAWKQ
jgi:hypothetical protein